MPLKEITTAIGRGLNVPVTSISPEQEQEDFDFLELFAEKDAHASSAQTRVKLRMESDLRSPSHRSRKNALYAGLSKGHNDTAYKLSRTQPI